MKLLQRLLTSESSRVALIEGAVPRDFAAVPLPEGELVGTVVRNEHQATIFLDSPLEAGVALLEYKNRIPFLGWKVYEEEFGPAGFALHHPEHGLVRPFAHPANEDTTSIRLEVDLSRKQPYPDHQPRLRVDSLFGSPSQGLFAALSDYGFQGGSFGGGSGRQYQEFYVFESARPIQDYLNLAGARLGEKGWKPRKIREPSIKALAWSKIEDRARWETLVWVIESPSDPAAKMILRYTYGPEMEGAMSWSSF